MHLIVLAWDVHRPGHLDPSVLSLARGLARAGHAPHVVTLGTGPTSTMALDGVEVTWVAEPPPVLPPARSRHDMTHVLGVASPTAAAAERVCRDAEVAVVVAVGWQTVWAATSVRASRNLPLVAVLGASVLDAAGGSIADDARLAAQAEWWLTYEARRVVTETDVVARLVRRAYRLPRGTVDVVAPAMDPTPSVDLIPDRVLLTGGPPGLAPAIEAAGGAVTDDPEAGARAGVAVVLDPERRDLALSAMAGGAALVVPDDGPLRGLVHGRRSGLRVPRDDASAIVEVVTSLLGAPRRRERLGAAARRRVLDRHRPEDVAAHLLSVVDDAIDEEARLRVPDATALRPMMDRAPALRLVPVGPPNGHHGVGPSG